MAPWRSHGSDWDDLGTKALQGTIEEMKTAYLVAGLAYGDEGKGATVDYLVRKRGADLVVRYNGGAQAAHNVITPDGRHHTFAQFGSGTFVPGVKTHLSKYMLVNPLNMMCEEEHLQEVGVKDAFDRLTVDGRALIITPYQKIVNRMLETSRGGKRHGSCGQGIGETRNDHLTHGDQVLFAANLGNEKLTKEKLEFIRQISLQKVNDIQNVPGREFLEDRDTVNWISDQYAHWPVKIVSSSHLGELLDTKMSVVFEGAQGVLLDEVYGQAPYNTWTDTTFNNAEILLSTMGFTGRKEKVGVLRTYFTRHGAGPFPTEDPDLCMPEPHNGTGEYQGSFRVGKFDWLAAKYSLKVVGGIDWLALNHLDCVPAGAAKEIANGLDVILGVEGFGPSSLARKCS